MKKISYIPKATVTEVSLLKRVVIFLEDGEFDRADEYCERVLDMNVENGEAYFYKLLAALRLNGKDALYELDEPFDCQPAYAKIMRFGSDGLKKEVADINASILARAEEKRLALLVEMANEQCESESITELTEAYKLFVSLEKKEEADACAAKIESIYDARYNELYLAAQETQQELNGKKEQSGSATDEKDGYDRYIKDNENKKVFDYSLLVAAAVAVIGILAVIYSVSNYLSVEGITFKTVLLCIVIKILPGVPLTGLSTVLSFRISKHLVKKQRENLIEDIDTAAQRAKEIGERLHNAESEALELKKELDERLEALKRLNEEYDAYLANKDE